MASKKAQHVSQRSGSWGRQGTDPQKRAWAHTSHHFSNTVTAGKATRHEHAWPCRCARCRRNWSSRPRNSRDDLSRRTFHLHPRPSRFQPQNQFVTRDNPTMVGKVSERVLAREGKCSSSKAMRRDAMR